MQVLNIALIMLVPVLVAIYTLNYGRWAWKQRLWGGAVGLFLLAILTVLGPALLLILHT